MESSNPREGQTDALAEGRRIYLGNLLYSSKPQEIEDALTASGFDDYVQIHISVDPVSGRNPGYCFVDFQQRESAERALESLSVTIRGRQAKVGPCQPKQQQRRNRWNQDDGQRQTGFQRWGDWKRSDENGDVPAGSPSSGKGTGQGPRAALAHFEEVFDQQKQARLYIGGLGRMVDQNQNHSEMTELLAGLNPIAIGKRITAQESMWKKPGNHNYCFVDFETAEDAEVALNALNGKPYDGDRLRVSYARGYPERSAQRGEGRRPAGRATLDESVPRKSAAAEAIAPEKQKAIESSSWRRKD